MHSRREQIQTSLWHDVLKHRIEIANHLVGKYEADDSPQNSRLVTLLKRDIAKTRRQLSLRAPGPRTKPPPGAHQRRPGGANRGG